jgi:hypothetical protein
MSYTFWTSTESTSPIDFEFKSIFLFIGAKLLFCLFESGFVLFKTINFANFN